MKAKAAVQHSNYHLVLAFIVMAIAFLFSLGVNAATAKTVSPKKVVKSSKAKLTSKAPVLKSKLAFTEKSKSSVMFLSSTQRQLLAQNSESQAADAKLESEFISEGNRVKLWDSTDAIAFIELGLSI